jgi:hypothetical protein
MNAKLVDDVLQINKNVYITNQLLSPFLCQRNHQHIFVFGDNFLGRGKGGQAVIRDEPNTIGLITKWYPHNQEYAFFSDDDPRAEQVLLASIDQIQGLIKQEKSIVLSSQGYGNGYARLPTVAPRLFKLLCTKLNELCGKEIYK